jgi:nicotinate-nucleotide adenylyltransferase
VTGPDHAAPRRLGVFGGTFDPPHTGHLAVAQDVLERLELDRVLFVPAGRPPHKTNGDLADAELRLAMVAAAVESDSRFRVSDMEVRRAGVSYTVDTLEALAETAPGADLFLLLGVDQWASFGGWRLPRRIGELCRLVVMSREGDHPEAVDPGFTDGPPPDVLDVPVTRMDISSTGIRDRIRGGRSVRYLVPDPVLRIIDSAGLYL